LMLNI